MKINVQKDLLLEKFGLASKFISNKLSSLTTLQGILLKGEKNKLHIYSTNLTSYVHTVIAIQTEEVFEAIVEPKKIVEFLQFLNSGKIEIELKDKQIIISQNKTKGNFPLIISDEFPLPPEIKDKGQVLDAPFLNKNLPLILFATSSDDTRPALTGVNFIESDDDLIMVSTDGFRLSLIKTKKRDEIPSMLVSGDFLEELLRLIKDEKEIIFSYLKNEKMIYFKVGDTQLYSRLIEGEFPPYERVIPTESKTSVLLNREEFLRNIKIISVFARDFSNVVVCEFKKDGLYLRPKKDNNVGNSAFQEIEIKGDEQKVAFNYKFVLDLLNNVNVKTLKIEILRPEAPIIFKSEENPNFLHIIMPVRIQEE